MLRRLTIIGSGICLGLLFLIYACSALPLSNALVPVNTPILNAVLTRLPASNATAALNGDPANPTPAEIDPRSKAIPPFPGAKLIFNEEFTGDRLDASHWTTEYRWGRTNEPELQYYSQDALQVKDGILRITADQHQMEEKNYLSGLIASYDRFTFTYGYLEMRAKIPSGQGLWPAFWMHLNDDDKSGEIDVFEFLGHEPNIIHMSYHFPELHEFWFNGPDYSQEYHIYAVDWQPDKIVWYIDGVERARATSSIPNEPMYIIANLAVGGDWPGSPDATTQFPAHFDIDYIRVYQH
jgi:beta-glucanase (GH16 family)